jgi:hypothetical protein
VSVGGPAGTSHDCQLWSFCIASSARKRAPTEVGAKFQGILIMTVPKRPQCKARRGIYTTWYMGTFDCESTICQTRLNLCGRFTRRNQPQNREPIKWQTNFGVRLIVTSNGPKRECCYGKPGHKQPHARRTLCSSRILSVPKQSRRKFGEEIDWKLQFPGASSEPGPPMDLANMRRQGVHHLIAYCLNDACPPPRHHRRVKLSWRYPSAMVPVQGEVRQVRRAEQSD